MDFFDRQSRALKTTKWLVLYFTLGVLLMVLTVYAAVVLVFGASGAKSEDGRRVPVAFTWWQPGLFLWSAVGTLTVIGCGSLVKTLELARGGSAVAEMLGGSLVQAHTTDPDERRLLNVVEEMALAAGVPVPQVYVLRREKGINAFAAGHHTGDAVVGVTDGTLRLLSRDELQGVIAHEFSHILYGDMRLNLRLMGVLFGILCLTIIGRILLQTRGGSRDKNPLPVLGIVLLAIGWIGFFFGRLIQAAVSRQREFLADAAAVQFTRNPEGLAGALKKIGGLSYGAALKSPQAGEASHMFFGNAMTKSLSGMFATHPPLVDRIRAIDPAFDGVFPKVTSRAARPEGSDAGGGGAARRRFPLPGGMSPLAPPGIAAPAVAAQVGAADSPQLRYARELRDNFPPALQAAAREPLGACAIVYGLLLSSESSLRARQLALLAEKTSPGVAAETERLLADVEGMAARARLPLVDLALPQLRQLAPGQFLEFREAVRALAEADEQIDLFEYVLQKAVVRHLEPNFVPVRRGTAQYYALQPLVSECSVLLSSLAHAGHDDPVGIREAFESGARVLRQQGQVEARLLPSHQCGLAEIDAALTRLAQTSPPLKRSVLDGCARAVATDGLIQETEWELLRAISDTLDCPLPIRVTERAAGVAA